MKSIAILYSEWSSTIDALLSQLSDFDVHSFKEGACDCSQYDLIIGVGNISEKYKGLACKHSLFPAFWESNNPEKDAVLEGVKVTGITIYYTEPFKIIAQYPLMISNSNHFDEIEQQLEYLEQVVYPLVAEKYAKNEVFDIQDLFKKSSCSGECSSCKGCEK